VRNRGRRVRPLLAEREVRECQAEVSKNFFHGNALAAALGEPCFALTYAPDIFFGYRVVIEGGATGTAVADSWFHDCRVGMYVWGAGDVALTANAVSEPREHAVVTDRGGLEVAGNDLDGDVWVAPT